MHKGKQEGGRGEPNNNKFCLKNALIRLNILMPIYKINKFNFRKRKYSILYQSNSYIEHVFVKIH